MTSKKYIIQPLPPSTSRSRASPLSKFSNSKKHKDPAGSLHLPFSPYHSSYASDVYDNPTLQGPPSPSSDKTVPLETDLATFRSYQQAESRFARSQSNVFMHPFKYIDQAEADSEGQEESESNGDFSTWMKDMNTKLMTKKKQIRTEKRRAERAVRKENARREAALSLTLSTLSPSTASISPASTTPKQQQHKRTLFPLGKKKTKDTNSEYDALEHVKVVPTQVCKPSKDKTKSDKSSSKSKPPDDLRLFQKVRTQSIIEEELHAAAAAAAAAAATPPTTPTAASSSSSSSSISSVSSTTPLPPSASSSSLSTTPPKSSSMPTVSPSALAPAISTTILTPSPSANIQFSKSKSFSAQKQKSTPGNKNTATNSSSITPTQTQTRTAHPSKRLPRNVVAVT